MLYIKCVVAVLLISTVAISSSAESSDDEKLTILTRSQQEIMAKYEKGNEGGLIIHSLISNNSIYINITSLTGSEVVFTHHSMLASASLLRIMGHSVYLEKEDGKWIEYVLPITVSHHFSKSLSDHQIPVELLQHLDSNSTDETKELMLRKLLTSPEILMAIDACHALGNAGIYGYENPAALNLFTTVLHFANWRDYKSLDVVMIDLREKRNRRSHQVCPNLRTSYVKYPNMLHLFTCSTCPQGSECLGMCGPGCSTCWWYVCEDCCYHQGCYDHDVCCGADFFSLACLIPIGFSCSSYEC